MSIASYFTKHTAHHVAATSLRALSLVASVLVGCGNPAYLHGADCAASVDAADSSMPPLDSGAATPERTEEIDVGGRTVVIRHGASQPPSVAGCADGTREAFHDVAMFPNIAGCMANWLGLPSMRVARTGSVCGDSVLCSAPTDACSTGWHLCGSDGAVADLRQVSGAECERAGAGRYSAAISHCSTQDFDCRRDTTTAARYECFREGFCSEAVCCGADCGEFGACRDGVWDGLTHIQVGQDQGCGRISAQRAGGVLCCRDR